MNHKQVALTGVAAAGLFAIGIFAASVFASPPSFNKRWHNAMTDLSQVHVAIPHAKLHARALEILQDRGEPIGRGLRQHRGVRDVRTRCRCPTRVNQCPIMEERS